MAPIRDAITRCVIDPINHSKHPRHPKSASARPSVATSAALDGRASCPRIARSDRIDQRAPRHQPLLHPNEPPQFSVSRQCESAARVRSVIRCRTVPRGTGPAVCVKVARRCPMSMSTLAPMQRATRSLDASHASVHRDGSDIHRRRLQHRTDQSPHATPMEVRIVIIDRRRSGATTSRRSIDLDRTKSTERTACLPSDSVGRSSGLRGIVVDTKSIETLDTQSAICDRTKTSSSILIARMVSSSATTTRRSEAFQQAVHP